MNTVILRILSLNGVSIRHADSIILDPHQLHSLELEVTAFEDVADAVIVLATTATSDVKLTCVEPACIEADPFSIAEVDAIAFAVPLQKGIQRVPLRFRITPVGTGLALGASLVRIEVSAVDAALDTLSDQPQVFFASVPA